MLVLDLPMPNGSSVETIQTLRAQAPNTEIVVITMHDSQKFADQAIKAGALGFVLKDTADTELPEALRRAAHGRQYISPRVR